MKTCSECGTAKLLSEFKRHAASPDGYTYVCKDCLRARRESLAHLTPDEKKRRQLDLLKEKYQNDPEYRERLRNHRRKSTYGIPPETFQAFYDRQRGLCAICGQPESGKGFHLDHDHASGQIRGLLCFMCNRGLGDFEDSIERMSAAIRYLKANRETLVVVPPTPRVRAQCGTPSGYNRHRRYGEDQCEACRHAWSAYNATKNRERVPGYARKRRQVVECGTNSGYTAHYARGEKPCDACKASKSAYMKALGAKKRAAS